MKKVYALILIIVGVVFMLVGQLLAFDAYYTHKMKSNATNMAVFLHKFAKGESSIKIPYPQESIVLHRQADGRVFATEGFTQTLKPEDYISGQHGGNTEGLTYVYLKRLSFGEYAQFLINNIFTLGLFLSGLLLLLLGIYLSVREAKSSPSVDKEIINSLKALRLVLATKDIIPKESTEEAKKIVDKIMKGVRT